MIKKMEMNQQLLMACEKGDVTEASKLLENGATVFAHRNGCQAIHVAVRHGNPEVASLLLKNGADVNAKNRFGDTALHIAVVRACKKCTEVLVQNGADPKIENRDGRDAMACAKMGWSRGRRSIAALLSHPAA
uniref:Ankyrin repeat protein n=1 Tax=Lotharella oceanica TaxID=641309 RepID=A0A7S2TJ10_9EUKA|mmetsp:Transcript_14720/g.27938  ORF Transcript_14720/g.27938 Transcript_14720/m.27938 type:complete len:133 (+) Transcript_14720:98-496(+)|eukprot:CAMPEP_0170172484 /NCGR_PEP_ID=MMETSP0040_2-20121228/5710_1 /TAXON_ID=641309 /ORGANISM="Lotharella oceanica, Strain CCMP622" /LENGTH=132 /DNA_ID=CAMNT_0010413151 /DNA_START=95 /DNA_END=493 /DNA_ORIENTATION=+